MAENKKCPLMSSDRSEPFMYCQKDGCELWYKCGDVEGCSLRIGAMSAHHFALTMVDVSNRLHNLVYPPERSETDGEATKP